MKNERKSNFGFFMTVGIAENFTFTNGGYIIKINPIANGIFYVPSENESINAAEYGKKYPIETPIAIARKIQPVKNRSKKESLLRSCAGVHVFKVIVKMILFIYFIFSCLFYKNYMQFLVRFEENVRCI